VEKRYDLHSHTVYSDGTLTPAELVARAKEKSIDVLALTDHDVTDGLAPAQAAAAIAGLHLVPGVEVSVTWRHQTIHVVGLGIDSSNAELQTGLTGLREFRGWRAEEIDRRLAKRRIPGSLAGARRFAQGRIVSRTHFARFLVQQGYVRSMANAFKQLLGQGCAGYVPGQWATLEAAVRWIKSAGGQAVLAHPARYKFSSGKLQTFLGEYKECGGEAIEVVSSSHNPDAVRHFTQVARDFGFLASMGSDYHGPEPASTEEKPWADLGRLPSLPPELVPVWRDWTFS
jgi:hypothetical protein